jgi:hypothetical protein
MSAIPAVSLVMATGLSVEFTAHITLAYLNGGGDSGNSNMAAALRQMSGPVIDGYFTSFLGIVMMLFSEFVFVRKYFFLLYFAIITVGLANGLLFLPVLLSLGVKALPSSSSSSGAVVSPDTIPSDDGSAKTAAPPPSRRLTAAERTFESLGDTITTPPVNVVLALSLLALCAALISGLATAEVETEVGKLWVETGGRLEDEIDYTKAHRRGDSDVNGFRPQLVIQESASADGNVLTVSALKEHYHLLKSVFEDVTVKYAGIDLTLVDICYRPKPPASLGALADLVPCIRSTVLDCFAEGAYDFTVEQDDVDTLWELSRPGSLIGDALRSYGIYGYSSDNTGYAAQQRPAHLPVRPSLDELQDDDLPALLGARCRGFAEKLPILYWPTELIMGWDNAGSGKSATAQTDCCGDDEECVCYANALQTVIAVAPPTDIAETLGICLEDAKEIVEKWEAAFLEYMETYNREDDPPTGVFPLVDTKAHVSVSSSMRRILESVSDANGPLIVAGYGLMFVYVLVTLRGRNGSASHTLLGFGGVLIVATANLASFGLCSYAGIKFNATSLQVLPFLSLGLGVDDMFVVIHTFHKECPCDTKAEDVRDKVSCLRPHFSLTSFVLLGHFFLQFFLLF